MEIMLGTTIAAGTTAAATTATAGLFGAGGKFALAQAIPTLFQGVSAMSSIQSGYAQEAAYQRQAERSEMAAKERELQRLRALRSAQASQRAYWTGRGVSGFTGSPETISRESTKAYQLERGADLSSTRYELNKLNAAGSQAVTAGWVKAGSTIGGMID